MVIGSRTSTKSLAALNNPPVKAPLRRRFTSKLRHRIPINASESKNGLEKKLKIKIKSALSGILDRRHGSSGGSCNISEKIREKAPTLKVDHLKSLDSRRSNHNVEETRLNLVANPQTSSNDTIKLTCNISPEEIYESTDQCLTLKAASKDPDTKQKQTPKTYWSRWNRKLPKEKKSLKKTTKKSQTQSNTKKYRLSNLSQAKSLSETCIIFSLKQKQKIAAAKASGLKAKESNPNDSKVHIIDLYSEYSNCRTSLKQNRTIIGRGASADVRLMRGKGSAIAEVFAVKEFHHNIVSETEEDYLQKVLNEFTIARSVQHPNIVKTFNLCSHKSRLCHVMEFCDHGDLLNLVGLKYLAQRERLSDRLCLFKQLIQGLDHLHNHGIAHRDIKPENLLLTQKSVLKIADFSVSQVSPDTHLGDGLLRNQAVKKLEHTSKCSHVIIPGSLPYVAPEVIADHTKYDARSLDVWAAAIVMLCLTANGVLWLEPKAGSSPLYDDLINGWANWETNHVPTLPTLPSNSSGNNDNDNNNDNNKSVQAHPTSLVTPLRQESSSLSKVKKSASMIVPAIDYPCVSFLDTFINPPILRRILLSMLHPNPQKRVSISTIAKNRWLRNVECCCVTTTNCRATVVINASKSECFMDQGDFTRFQKTIFHNHLPYTKK